jgi:Zn-dependent protease
MLERMPAHERRDLIIAWLAISVAFALIFIRAGRATPLGFIIFFGVSLLTVGIGFILHEMAHKYTAMRYGFWAEFRKDNMMLLVAIAMAALAGVVFAAPGATMIYGAYISREQNGRISAAGPVTNLLLCIPFALLIFAGPIVGLPLFWTGILVLIGTVGIQVNAMIATFNLLPISVLDGRKVLAWNPVIFAALFIAALGTLLVSLVYL